MDHSRATTGTRYISRATFSDAGEKFSFGAAPVGAAAGDQKAVLAGDDVALAQRRVVLDLDRRETDLVLAVAGAAR